MKTTSLKIGLICAALLAGALQAMALEGAVVVGGLSALGAGLYSMGIPKNSIIQYETAVKSGKYVLIAHGSDMETIHAREILKNTDHEALAEHQPKRISNEASVMTA